MKIIKAGAAAAVVASAACASIAACTSSPQYTSLTSKSVTFTCKVASDNGVTSAGEVVSVTATNSGSQPARGDLLTVELVYLNPYATQGTGETIDSVGIHKELTLGAGQTVAVGTYPESDVNLLSYNPTCYGVSVSP